MSSIITLVEDDQLALETFEEAANVMPAPALRRLFVMLLEWMPIKDPTSLWERYSMELSEDYLYDKFTHQRTIALFITALARASALRDLHRLCAERNIDHALHLPIPEVSTSLDPSSKAVAQEMRYDAETQRQQYEELFALVQANPEQLAVLAAVRKALDGGKANVIYVDGPAGAGKD